MKNYVLKIYLNDPPINVIQMVFTGPAVSVDLLSETLHSLLPVHR